MITAKLTPEQIKGAKWLVAQPRSEISRLIPIPSDTRTCALSQDHTAPNIRDLYDQCKGIWREFKDYQRFYQKESQAGLIVGL